MSVRPFIQAYKSDGTKPLMDALTGYNTLASGSTYYFELTGPRDLLCSAHLQWDSAIILTSVVMEDTNLPGSVASAYSSTAGNWLTENPTTAYIPVTGAGVTVSNATVAATGGAAGACMINIADQGSYRQRIKVVVAGTGGLLRCAVWNKGQ